MVHECLKCGRGIAKSKEHDGGFKQSHGGNGGGLSLVLLSGADVVVSPLKVKLGKQGRLLHVIDKFRNEGERVGILDCVGVQVVVVLAWT